MILVIGGNGFVGSGIVAACKERGIPCEVVTRQNYAMLRQQPCDILINANGNSKKYVSRTDPVGDFEASVLSVRRAVEDFTYNAYVQISSCDVYADCSSPSTTGEDQVIQPAGPSTYGFHKRLAEMCVQHTAKRWLICRMGGFVGPGMKKNAIFDILSGHPLWLHPDSALQFMHTRDAGNIILDLCEGERWSEVLNVCGAGVVALKDVIEWSGRVVDVKSEAELVRYEVSTRKLSALMEVPATAETVERFVKEYVAADRAHRGAA